MILEHGRCTFSEILSPGASSNAKNPFDMPDFFIVYSDQQKASSYQLNIVPFSEALVNQKFPRRCAWLKGRIIQFAPNEF